MFRFVWSAALPALLLTSQLAFGDEVRRTAFAAPLIGTWAPSADLCGRQHSAITIAKSAYAGPGGKCRVAWIVETPGPFGPSYGVHATCVGRDKTARAIDSIFRPEGDRLLVGGSFETLRPYQRCS